MPDKYLTFKAEDSVNGVDIGPVSLYVRADGNAAHYHLSASWCSRPDALKLADALGVEFREV